jgi:hypothetical protein
MDRAERAQVSWLAWTFHMRCPPSLLQDASTQTNACGIGMALAPTAWGDSVKQRLSKPPLGTLP